MLISDVVPSVRVLCWRGFLLSEGLIRIEKSSACDNVGDYYSCLNSAPCYEASGIHKSFHTLYPFWSPWCNSQEAHGSSQRNYRRLTAIFFLNFRVIFRVIFVCKRAYKPRKIVYKFMTDLTWKNPASPISTVFAGFLYDRGDRIRTKRLKPPKY